MKDFPNIYRRLILPALVFKGYKGRPHTDRLTAVVDFFAAFMFHIGLLVVVAASVRLIKLWLQ
jgi:hypothetical protein